MLLFLRLSLFSSGLVSYAPLLRALLDFLSIMVLFCFVCSLSSMPATMVGIHPHIKENSHSPVFSYFPLSEVEKKLSAPTTSLPLTQPGSCARILVPTGAHLLVPS